jgi:hypothetical protein
VCFWREKSYMEKLLNLREADELLNVQPRWLRNRCSIRWTRQRGLKPVKFIRLGNMLRFIPGDLIEYLRSLEFGISKNEKEY